MNQKFLYNIHNNPDAFIKLIGKDKYNRLRAYADADQYGSSVKGLSELDSYKLYQNLNTNYDGFVNAIGKNKAAQLYNSAKADYNNDAKTAAKFKNGYSADILNASAWLKDKFVYESTYEDKLRKKIGVVPSAFDSAARDIVKQAKDITRAQQPASLRAWDDMITGNKPPTEDELREAIGVINKATGTSPYKKQETIRLNPQEQMHSQYMNRTESKFGIPYPGAPGNGDPEHGLIRLPGTGKPGMSVTLPYREPKDKGHFSVQEPMRIQLTSGQPGLNDNGGDEKTQDDKRDPLTEDHVYITQDEYISYLDALEDEYNTYYSETDKYGNPKPKATPEDFNKKKVKLEENWQWSKEQDDEKKEEPVTLYYPGTGGFDDYINREDYGNAEDYYNAVAQRCLDYVNNGDEEGFKKFLNENKIDPFTMSYVGEYIEKQRKQNDKAQIVAGKPATYDTQTINIPLGEVDNMSNGTVKIDGILIPAPGVELTNTKTGEKVTSEDIDFDTALGFLDAIDTDKVITNEQAKIVGFLDNYIANTANDENLKQAAISERGAALETLWANRGYFPGTGPKVNGSTISVLLSNGYTNNTLTNNYEDTTTVSMDLATGLINELPGWENTKYNNTIRETNDKISILMLQKEIGVEPDPRLLQEVKKVIPNFEDFYNTVQPGSYFAMTEGSKKELINRLVNDYDQATFEKNREANNIQFVIDAKTDPNYLQIAEDYMAKNNGAFRLFAGWKENLKNAIYHYKLNPKIGPERILAPELYDYMHPDELYMAAYYLATDEKKAEEYVKNLETILTERQANTLKEKIDITGSTWYGKTGLAVGTVLTAPGQVWSLVGSGVDAITGKRADPNASYNLSSMFVSEGREKVLEGSTGLGRALGELGFSALDMVAALPLGEAGILYLMASETGGAVAYQALESGATPEQAVLMGLTAAFTEYLTEKIPLNRLFKLADDVKLGKLSRGEIAKMAGINASIGSGQELLSAIANSVEDMAIMGDKSQFSQRVNALMADGKSRDEAESTAYQEMVGGWLEQAGGGFLLDSIFSGGAIVIGGKKGGTGTDIDSKGKIGDNNNGIGGTGKLITEIKFKPSSGAVLKASAGKTTTILGNYDKDMRFILSETGNVKSTDFGPRDGGINILNVPDYIYKKLTPEQFWERYNKRWLDNAIKRGDNIVLATKPEGKYLSYIDNDTGKEVITGFGREYNHLIKNGYIYDPITNMMVPKQGG